MVACQFCPIIVRGKLVSRGETKRADYIFYYKPNIPGDRGEFRPRQGHARP